MPIEHKKLEFKLHEHLIQIQEILTLLEVEPDMFSIIEENKNLLKTKKYNIAVMGEFKRGKSSLINALLGLKILPADVEPATATINRITYGPKLRAVVDFKDGTNLEVDINELADYVTKLTPEGASRAASIKEAIVYTPTVICQNYVDIIDTPGLNDNAEMTRITIEMLNKIDAVIVTIHARAPFSETERDFVCELIKSENINNIVFTVTFIDMLDEEDYDYDSFMEYIKNRIYKEVTEKLKRDNEPENTLLKAEEILGNVCIFGISSMQALKFFLTNDKKALKISRFDVFKTGLMKVVTAKQAENAIINVVRDINTVISNLDSYYNINKQAYSDKLKLIEEATLKIKDLCNGFGRQLSLKFTQRDADIENRIKSLFTVKNIMITNFIKGLSTLKTDNQSDIESIILQTANSQRENLNNTLIADVKKEIISILEEKIKGFNDIHLQELKENLALMEINKSIDLESEKQVINSLITSIEFTWGNPPHLYFNHEPIDHISNTIDISITKMINDLNDGVDKARESIFRAINSLSEEINELVDHIRSESLSAMQIKKAVYTSNYEKVKNTANEITKSTASILNEFKGKNR